MGYRLGFVAKIGNKYEERYLVTSKRFREYMENDSDWLSLKKVLSGTSEEIENAIIEADQRGKSFSASSEDIKITASILFDDVPASEELDFFLTDGMEKEDPTLSELANWYCVLGPKEITDELGIKVRIIRDSRYTELLSLYPKLHLLYDDYRFGSLHYSELIASAKQKGIITDSAKVFEELMNEKKQEDFSIEL